LKIENTPTFKVILNFGNIVPDKGRVICNTLGVRIILPFQGFSFNALKLKKMLSNFKALKFII